MSPLAYLARLAKLLRSPLPARTAEPTRFDKEPARVVEATRQPEPPRNPLDVQAG
jgi:hypothetical protein